MSRSRPAGPASGPICSSDRFSLPTSIREPILVGRAKREDDYGREADELDVNWPKGYFHFFCSRTKDEYKRKATSARRKEAETKIGLRCPMIDDKVLKSLFLYVNEQNYRAMSRRFPKRNPFRITPSERVFLETLNKAIDENPDFQALKVVPRNAKEWEKWSIGRHVPDVLILGIKPKKGFSAVIIEVMGGAHEEKWKKDELFFKHMDELGIVVFHIYNEKVRDVEYVRRTFSDLPLS